MSCLLTYVQRAGLVSMLLIVGVLGGFITPPSAKAHPPSITIEVFPTNGLSPTSTTLTVGNGLSNATSTCTPGNSTPVPNYCYNITTGGIYGPATSADGTKKGRQFKLNPISGQVAQLQIADYGCCKIGSTNVSCDVRVQTCDNITLTGVQILPVCPSYPCASTFWNDSEKTVVRITLNNTFNQLPGPAAPSPAKYLYALQLDGYFESCSRPGLSRGTCSNTANGDISFFYAKATVPNGTTLNVSNATNKDADVFPASGTPAPADNNAVVNPYPGACDENNAAWSTMCTTITTTLSDQSALTFSADQISPYPAFSCTNGAANANNLTLIDALNRTITYSNPNCQITGKHTHVFWLFGADSVYLSASSNGGAGGPCDGPGNPPCNCDAKKPSLCNAMNKFFDTEKQKSRLLQAGIPEGVQCNPSICNGQIVQTFNLSVNRNGTPPCLDESGNVVDCSLFKFHAQGPRLDDFQVTIPETSGTYDALTNLITGPSGQNTVALLIAPDYDSFPKFGGKFVEVDQILVESINGSTNVDQASANPDVEVINCAGGHKGPVLFHNIGNLDKIKLTWHLHTSTTKGEVCILE